MILGVAGYALFGALVMQKLESKMVQRTRRESMNDSLVNDSLVVRHKREISQIVHDQKCVLRALKKLVDFDCDSNILERVTIRSIEHCYHVTTRNERSLEGIMFKSTSEGMELGEFKLLN
jgi:hypothetical protein